MVKGIGNRSKKKRRVAGHSNSKKESDFVEDLVRDCKKKSEIKGKRVKDSSRQRDSSPFADDETLARQLEKKRYPFRRLDKDLDDKGDLGDEDSQEQGIHADREDRYVGSPRSMIGMHGNSGAILKEIGVMKSQI